MEWIRENWLWLAVAALFIWMHSGMHRGHGGGCGGHGGGRARPGQEGTEREEESHVGH